MSLPSCQQFENYIKLAIDFYMELNVLTYHVAVVHLKSLKCFKPLPSKPPNQLPILLYNPLIPHPLPQTPTLRF